MTGKDLRSIRVDLGLSRAAFGAALGYRQSRNLFGLIGRYESGRKPIPPRLAEAARSLRAQHPRQGDTDER